MYPTLHAYLRDRERWQASSTGFVAAANGALQLAAVPTLQEPVDAPLPYSVPNSGVAAAPCCSVFVADTTGARVLYRDGLCGDEAVLPRPGHDCGAPLFESPRGLALNRHFLAVADAGGAQVLLFRAEDLSLARVLGQPSVQPIAVALDRDSRVYVLDGSTPRVLRWSEHGVVDTAYAQALASQITQPAGIALDAQERLLISVAASKKVLRFDANGQVIATLAAPSDWMPTALAVDGERTYVADALRGFIHVFDCDTWIGVVPRFRGPVAALAAADGALHIKMDASAEVLTACTANGLLQHGELLAGPLDAGERDGWERVAVEASANTPSQVQLDVFFDSTTTPPASNEWITAPAHDVLLATLEPTVAYPGNALQRRYLWIRVRLLATPGAPSPKLEQVHAATRDENYMRHLPAIYAEQDASTGLERMLHLLRTEVSGAEALLQSLPQRVTPPFASADSLPWLARWLAFELPSGVDVSTRRDVLARVSDLYRRRGTVAGLLEFVHLYTGVRPKVVEWYRERRIWQLGVTSALGFDTALPAGAVDGITVADPSILEHTDPALGCSEPERLVVGHAVVGADRPASVADFGCVLFDDSAHRISVLIPAGLAPEGALRERIREVIAAEAPAHVICEVCFIEPRLRIGVQARIGIDSILAGDPPPLRLAESHWSTDSVLGPSKRAALRNNLGDDMRIGQRARIGSGLILG